MRICARKDKAGISLDDCKVKLEGENCSPSQAACNAGTKFNAGNAQSCIDQFSTYSCNDFTSNPPTPPPAICNQVCQ